MLVIIRKRVTCIIVNTLFRRVGLVRPLLWFPMSSTFFLLMAMSIIAVQAIFWLR